MPRGANSISQAKMAHGVYIRMVLLGEKLTPKLGLEANILDQICEPKEVMNEAVKMGKKWAPKSEAKLAFKAIKEIIYEYPIECAVERPGNVGERLNRPKL